VKQKSPTKRWIFTVLAMENGPFIDGIYIYIWLVVSTYPSEKYKFVSWDNDISKKKWKNKINVPNHQTERDFYSSNISGWWF